MSQECENILQPWEAESYVENLQPAKLEIVGTKIWFEYHKKLTLLHQQSILEINTLREEAIKEWFVSFQKISILIYEAIQMAVWKYKIFPLLVELNGEPSNTFMLYSVFYHEIIVVSLLENVLFHSDSAETLDDSILDLIDYAVDNVTALVSKTNVPKENKDDVESCLQELLRKKSEMEFEIGIKCISILRYLAEFSEKLPLCVLSRMLSTHDVPYLLTELIQKHPWRKTDEKGELFMYNNGNWEKMDSRNGDKLCKVEGQIWIGLRELLLNPTSAPYYELTDFRISQLTKLQKYLQEHVLDQIAPLIELRRWLSYLNISRQTSTSKPPMVVEVMPHIRSSIMDEYSKKWKKLAKSQSQFLYTKDVDHIKSMAQVLTPVYDMDNWDMCRKKECSYCRETATKRCSKCKGVWYCGRECQVKDWVNHKQACTWMTKSKEGHDVNDTQEL